MSAVDSVGYTAQDNVAMRCIISTYINTKMCVCLCVCVCLYAFFSAIWNPIGIPFGTKLLLGPEWVLKQ